MEEKKDKDGIKDEKTESKGESGALKVGPLSGRVSRTNKAYHLLEAQGIIVGKTLGSGSYATVKSAYDINRKHKVAVKIINKKKAFEEYLTKFLPREIEAMRGIGNHANVVAFYQIIETTSRYFFMMELADGGDLLEAIRTKKMIEEGQAGIWFTHLYDGLYHLHTKGFVHRDIKCENLLLDKENNLKITDFGFAKKIVKSKSGQLATSETYCGSYAYAAPEILKGQPYDAGLAEVWSTGVVLYTMVSSDKQQYVITPMHSNVIEGCKRDNFIPLPLFIYKNGGSRGLILYYIGVLTRTVT